MNRLNPLRSNLTKDAVDSLLAPASGREEIRDADGKQSVNGLSIRITSTGKRTWCVFRRIKGGQPVRLTIGTYPDVTPTLAREKAKELLSGLAIGKAPKKALSVKAQIEAKRDRKQHTLESLTTAYCDFQQSRGRSSHLDARSIFRIHLVEAKPSLSAKPAADVTTEEVVDLLRAVKDGGKARTSNKLRAYLRASYETAIAAHTSHEYPVSFKAFAIRQNPVAGTKADSSADKADKNPLNLNELRAYWKAIEALPGREGAALRLHLLSGGQRVEQLVQLRRANASNEAITLLDSKGRPRGGDARQHVVPLTKTAAAALGSLVTASDFVFSVADGSKPMDATTLSRQAAKYAQAINGFALKRVRSGVETLLASRGVSEEVRGRLQSHGVSGVQSRHYNAHDYLPEKLAALQLLESALTGADAKVIGIRAA